MVSNRVRFPVQFLKPPPMLIQDLVKLAIKENGATYNPQSHELNPSVGYMVSLKGFERKASELTEDEIFAFLLEHQDRLTPTNYIGIWKDGIWYLDISIHILDLDLAMKVAEKNEQIAIWDCANKEAIYLVTVK